MQLRKVCNHPNLFEPRPTVSPFVGQPADPGLHHRLLRHGSLVPSFGLDYHPLLLSAHEDMTGYCAYKAHRLRAPRGPLWDCLAKNQTLLPVKVPQGKIRLVMKATPVTGSGHMPATSHLSFRPAGERIPMATVVNSGLWQLKRLDTLIRTGNGSYVLSRQPRLPDRLQQAVTANKVMAEAPLSQYYSKECYR